MGEPRLVTELLSEVLTWRGLTVVELPVEDELVACELAGNVDLDFDDGLPYYYAKKTG
ncbi:MAG: hypothetical protein QW099_07020 [Candidatus Bathyarchaeia archaeon]